MTLKSLLRSVIFLVLFFTSSLYQFHTANASKVMTVDNQVDWNLVKKELSKNKKNRTVVQSSGKLNCHRERYRDRKDTVVLRFYGGIGGNGDIISIGNNLGSALFRLGLDVEHQSFYFGFDIFGIFGGEAGSAKSIGGSFGSQLKFGISLGNNLTSLYFITSAEYLEYISRDMKDAFLGIGNGIKQDINKYISLFIEYRVSFPVYITSNHSFLYNNSVGTMLFSVSSGIDFYF